MVGHKVSGNGDILGFAYNSDRIINGIGTASPDPSGHPGPTITGIIDSRDPDSSPNVLDSYVIQEGAIPAALAPIMQVALEVTSKKVYLRMKYSEWLRILLSSFRKIMFGSHAASGSLNKTQTFLVMSHDNNEGFVKLENDEAYLEFVGVAKTKQAQKLRAILEKASRAIGATFVDSPFYAGKCGRDIRHQASIFKSFYLAA